MGPVRRGSWACGGPDGASDRRSTPHDSFAPSGEDPPMIGRHAPRHSLTSRLLWLHLVAAVITLIGSAGVATPAQAEASTTWGPQVPPACPTATYTVPAGVHYVEVIAIGGAGRGGWTFNDNNTGGPGGAGAKVTAHLPVTPGQQLKVVVAHNGDAAVTSAGYPNGGGTPFASGKGGGSSVVTTSAGDP